MSYQPPQDPNNPGQYGGYGGYTSPPNAGDPYSGQPQYGQPGQGAYQQPGQQPNYQQGGYQQYGQQGYQPPFGQQQFAGQSATATGPTSTGLPANVAAGLSVLFTWVGGLVFFLIEKQNRFVRFHAMQSILFFLPLFVVYYIAGWIPLIGGILASLLALLGLIVWILLMVMAFQGKYYKLPYVGDYAEKYANQGVTM